MEKEKGLAHEGPITLEGTAYRESMS